jgi:hypothetical protein
VVRPQAPQPIGGMPGRSHSRPRNSLRSVVLGRGPNLFSQGEGSAGAPAIGRGDVRGWFPRVGTRRLSNGDDLPPASSWVSSILFSASPSIPASGRKIISQNSPEPSGATSERLVAKSVEPDPNLPLGGHVKEPGMWHEGTLATQSSRDSLVQDPPERSGRRIRGGGVFLGFADLDPVIPAVGRRACRSSVHLAPSRPLPPHVVSMLSRHSSLLSHPQTIEGAHRTQGVGSVSYRVLSSRPDTRPSRSNGISFQSLCQVAEEIRSGPEKISLPPFPSASIPSPFRSPGNCVGTPRCREKGSWGTFGTPPWETVVGGKRDLRDARESALFRPPVLWGSGPGSPL